MRILYNLLYIIWLANAQLEIKPSFEFHDRRRSIIITCDGSSITDNISMTFSYMLKKYTVPRINNIPGIYIGNFSAVSTDQSEVMISCANNNTGKEIGSKSYVLGYPPSIIPQHFKLELICRDFNYNKIECRLDPGEKKIELLLGFKIRKFTSTLFFTDSDNAPVVPINGIFHLGNFVVAPTLDLKIVIENMIGNYTFNYNSNRNDIQKPNEPIIEIKKIYGTNFTFTVNMTDPGIYMVTLTCNVSSPTIMTKIKSFRMFRTESEILSSDNFPQNSFLSCIFTAQIMHGSETIGQTSDSSTELITLLESKPNTGPYSSSLFVDYKSISDEGMMRDVVVYFTNVDLIHRNGIIVKYRWSCEHCFLKGSDVSGVVKYLPGNVRSLKLDKVLLKTDLSLSACTKEGCSDLWTTVTFQRLRDDAPSRRLSVIKHPRNHDNLSIIWNEDVNVKNPLFLLVCTHSFIEHDCSAIEIIKLANGSRMTDLTINDKFKWRFAIISKNKKDNYKLKWVSCFHDSLSLYETEGKLRHLDYNRFIKPTTVCSLSDCYFILNFNIPNCKEFNSSFFNTIIVRYESNIGIKDFAVPLTNIDQIQFTLTDLSPGLRTYKVNISIASSINVTTMWFQKTFTTKFWSWLYVGVVIAAFFVLILAIIVLLYGLRKKLSNKYFKKKFQPIKKDFSTKNEAISTFHIMNNEDIEIRQGRSSSTDNSYQDKESTISSPLNSSEGSSGSGEQITNISDDNSIQYTSRPNVNKYAQIGVPVDKNDLHKTSMTLENRISVSIPQSA